MSGVEFMYMISPDAYRKGSIYQTVDDDTYLFTIDLNDLNPGISVVDLDYWRTWLTSVCACSHNTDHRLPGSKIGERKPDSS
jgi:hypothetical protein